MSIQKQLSIFLVSIVLFASCSKKISYDSPLAKSYNPIVLIPTTTNVLYAIDAATGLKLWEYRSLNVASNSPVVLWDSVAILKGPSEFEAVNIKTGKLIYKKSYAQNNYNPFAYNNFLYVSVKYVAKDTIFKFDRDGTILWRNYMPDNATQSPVAGDGKLFFPAGNKIFCFDPNSNNYTGPLWNKVLPTPIGSNPTYSKGFIYVTSSAGKVYKLDPNNNGAIVWTYSTGDLINGAPIVYGEFVVVASDDNKVHCIDINTGLSSTRWTFAAKDRIQSSPCLDKENENVLVGSHDFNLYAINHVTGKLRWKFPAGSVIKTSPVQYNGTTIFTCFDKYCYCVKSQTGDLIWKYNLNNVTEASPVVATFGSINYYPAVCGNSEY